MNTVEFGLFIAIGIVGIVAFYGTLMVVFRRGRAREGPILAVVVKALALATVMVGFWPFYGLYRLSRRLKSHPPATSISSSP